jgi:glycosyltransferase involved in cell wall biosynthesis
LELASAHVIACCRYAADPLREYVAPERLNVVYNGVAEMARPRLLGTHRILRIGVVGRIEAEKGQLQFVEAVRMISQQVPDCRFAIFGAPMFSGVDYYRKIVRLSDGLPIDIFGWQDDIASIYSKLDLLVVPSSAAEATTRVVLEAYGAGVPVIAFPVGGISEILQDESTGFLTKAATSEALAQRILSVLRMDPSSVNSVVRRARKEWESRFTLRAYRDSVCSVLMQAMQPACQHCYNELRVPAGVPID